MKYGAVLISKDEDFMLLRLADPAGPRVVWIRFGNATRRHILSRFAESWSTILASLQTEGVVEVR